MGILPSRRGRGRGAYRSRGRGRGRSLPIFRATRSVDRRPKQVLVSGYMQEEKDQLIEHMKVCKVNLKELFLQQFDFLSTGQCTLK